VSRLLPLVPAEAAPVAGPVPAGERGALVISDRAARRVATAALTEVADLGGTTRWGAGSAGSSRDPAVTARVGVGTAELGVRCSVTYPAPVGRVVEEARAHLVDRMRELTGLAVGRVDIAVTVVPPPRAGHRELR
jgi:uncharacterized alkaline shock family protein YloU